MAKLEHTLRGDFDQWLSRIEEGILNGSISASMEESSDFRCEDARCSVRVFERFSHAGGNRVSMNVTLFQGSDGIIHLSNHSRRQSGRVLQNQHIGRRSFLG